MLASLPEMWVAVGLVSVSAIRFLLFIQENDASPDTILCDDRRPGWLSWPGGSGWMLALLRRERVQ